MHTVFALLCFVVVIHWLIFPYPSGLLHWHCGNLTIAPVPARQPWWIWINTSCEFIMNDCITTTKQSTTKPCAYFLGHTVRLFGWLSVTIGISVLRVWAGVTVWADYVSGHVWVGVSEWTGVNGCECVRRRECVEWTDMNVRAGVNVLLVSGYGQVRTGACLYWYNCANEYLECLVVIGYIIHVFDACDLILMCINSFSGANVIS